MAINTTYQQNGGYGMGPSNTYSSSSSSSSSYGTVLGSFHAPIDLTQEEEEEEEEEDTAPKQRATIRQPHQSTPAQGKKPAENAPTRKRKSNHSHSHSASPPAAKKKSPPEKRLRVFRNRAPLAYNEIRHRALTQRMFVLDRQRTLPPADTDPASPDNHPTEVISLAGSTGNVYRITISRQPSCTCPHARKGHQCKHIVYVLARVLRASADVEYQLAFLSAELREMFARAPPLPEEVAAAEQRDREADGKRKALEGEDCPICMMEFETGAAAGKEEDVVVYCRAACGNNIHQTCFLQWAATKRGQGHVTCPFCRTPWQDGETDAAAAAGLKGVAMRGSVNAEGYVNVARELGISGQRDYSTYNEYWVRRQFGDDYSGDFW